MQIILNEKKIKIFKLVLNEILIKIKRIIRLLYGRDLYYVIGDSHSTNFTHEAFIVNHIGPATAYKLRHKTSTTNSNKKIINILKRIYDGKSINVIFVFGEIDSRLHIYKYAKENNISISKAIDNTLKSYELFLRSIKKLFPLLNIYVFNILPSGEQRNVYKYAYYASHNERVKIMEEMNVKLSLICKKNKFTFIKIYHLLTDKEGYRKKQFVFDKVHYNKNILPLILNELDKIS